MILPTKHLQHDRALLAVGADILALTDEPKTVSRLWDEFQKRRAGRPRTVAVGFDWFVLGIDLLFLVGAVEFDRGRLRRTKT